MLYCLLGCCSAKLHSHFTADTAGWRLCLLTCWSGKRGCSFTTSVPRIYFHLCLTVVCQHLLSLVFSNKLVSLAMKPFFVLVLFPLNKAITLVEIRFTNSKKTNGDARHLPHRSSRHLWFETSNNKPHALGKVTFKKKQIAAQHWHIKPHYWPDNKVRHSLSWIMVQMKQPNTVTGKWIKEALYMITACCRKISGIYQQPNFPNLFWQWGKLICWGDTATKWVDFIDWLILNLILYGLGGSCRDCELNRRGQSDECVSKASAVALPSFEETVEQTRLSIWREALHSGGVDVHAFM